MEINDILSLSFFISALRVSVPLVFAAQGGILSERSGIVQIALEGFMLIGAFTGAVFAHYMNSAAWGFLLAFIFGSLFSLMFSFFTVKLKSDQIVIGTGFNLLIAGLIPFISKFLFNSTGSTPSLPVEIRFSYEPLVFSVLTVVLVHLFLNKMRAGYWIQFAGEHPETLLSAGVSVPKIRTWSLFFCGGIAALGGASLSLFLSSNYSPLMTGGRGFIALSAVILGKWKPLPTYLACLLFGVLDALQIRLQGVEISGIKIPVQWIQILPYLLTIIILAGLFGKSRAPQFLGKK
jgi:simple sugar transport system permease protein